MGANISCHNIHTLNRVSDHNCSTRKQNGQINAWRENHGQRIEKKNKQTKKHTKTKITSGDKKKVIQTCFTFQ